MSSFFKNRYTIFNNTFELFDIITIILSIILLSLAFADLILLYTNTTKPVAWEYVISSLTFFLPGIITFLQWKYERNRECKVAPESMPYMLEDKF